jgi:hypothetical protein
MMKAEAVSETLGIDSILTLLTTQEDFIVVSYHESFKSDIALILGHIGERITGFNQLMVA